MIPSSLKRIEPCLKMTGSLGTANPVVFDLTGYSRIDTLRFRYNITRAANATQALQPPQVTDALGSFVLKAGNGSPQRVRLASDIFGAQGINALFDANNGGSVTYTQAGNATLSKVPVLIGSAADTAQRALVTANTACSAEFLLPISFVEYFRKEYMTAELLGFPTEFEDGSRLKTTLIEVQTAANIAVPAITVNSLSLSVKYDKELLKTGSPVMLMKEYRQTANYAGVGDVEVAMPLPLVNGDLMRLSLLTTTDSISKVVVKLDDVVIKNITFSEMFQELATADYNVNAIVANRFEIEFDANDFPNAGMKLNANSRLSIIATMATANDANKTIVLLPTIYGKLD